jgi:preprotein translocase subunit YajC
MHYFIMLFLSFGYADEVALPTGSEMLAANQTNPFLNLVPFALMFGVVYFLMIRPQQKKMKEVQSMLDNLKSGDEVFTVSGIIGKITQIQDKLVHLEIAQNVELRLIKSQINGIFKSP